MKDSVISVRELQVSDVEEILKYWFESDNDHLISMGVDLNKMPDKAEFEKMLLSQIDQAYNEKQSYCLIWLLNNKPVGHSNVNRIKYGEEAYMHLHIWNAGIRRQGLGKELVKMTLPFFFDNLKLKKLYCEPYALNPAPNKTLEKVGFNFIKEYTTIPGSLNFEQKVIRWELTHLAYKALKSD
ncbi:GNAT family N-acetyltransferase [Pontibacter sp. MBLB2868]|uniref:GNAT family N-acetyltransferase n=1 Tax=Pontibacter sp. MBLB2868 TaxID=3451555 RepID=UPI003F74E559